MIESPTYFSLEDLPQRGSVADAAYGCGWFELDEIFKFYPGQFVVVTGIAGQGKSTFIMNVLAKMAHEDGVKCFLYVPENEGYLREKLRLLWPGDDSSFQHFCASQCFVESSNADAMKDMAWVLNRAAAAVKNEKIEIVLIDPWNELDRNKPKDINLTDYIAQCLMQVKDFCRAMECTVIVVAHPTKAVNENGGRPVNLSDIESSMAWFNKCDNGLIVSRENNTAKIISAKVREIGAGRLGACHFTVNPKTGVFAPMYGAVST